MYNSSWIIAEDVEVSGSVKILTMAIFCVVTFVGITGNLLTMTSIFLNRKLKSIPNVYICNLATADLIVCMVIAPFSAYVSMYGIDGVNQHVCTFIGALNVGLLGKTIYGLTAIAVNRFVLIVKGGQTYSQFYTRRNVAISVVILWTLPLLLVLPALLGFGQFGYNSMMGTCIFVSHDTMTYIYVQIILHGVCVGPCVFITLLCYTKIIVRFRRIQYQIRLSEKGGYNSSPRSGSKEKATEYVASSDSKIEEYELSSSGPSNNNTSTTTAGQVRAHKRARASRRVVTNLCTVFSVFLMCWLPIVSIYTIDFYNRFPAAVSHIFYALAVCNSCVNVFIYGGMNSAFRKTYINILTCNFKRINSEF